MPTFSDRSKEQLSTCHPDLQKVFNEVIKYMDCTVIQGHRSEEEQEEYFRTGKSKLRAGNSKHNEVPSRAVDVVPYPIDWKDKERFYHFIGYVRGTAHAMGICLRSGGDWNMNNRFSDQTFNDLPHFELLG